MINDIHQNDSRNFLTISDVSIYLRIKEKTLYARVAAGDIPHYKIGRLVRFKKTDIDAWMESQKVILVDHSRIASDIIRMVKRKEGDVHSIVRKKIDEVRRSAYSSKHGKPDHDVKGLGKEVI